MVKDYINNDENISELGYILNTLNSNKDKFIECSLHTLENPYLNVECCAQEESSMDYDDVFW